MVSVEKITYKFSRLDEFLAILKGMQSTPLGRLVHLYGDIEDAYVHNFISNNLKDILNFEAAIAGKFLSS